MQKDSGIMIPDEIIMAKIYLIRGKKIMFDRDLAELYNVETRRLKEQVRRNLYRFPEDFMFELSNQELVEWREKYGKSSKESKGLRILLFVFTEHGVLMLASVLSSERAIQINIQIVRIFYKMRELLLSHKDILTRLGKIENHLEDNDEKIVMIIEYLKQFEKAKRIEKNQENRQRIGYKQSKL